MATTKTKKTEDTNIDNINNDEEGENEMNGTATQTVIANGINGNGYSNGNGYKLSEIRAIDLTLDEFDNLSPEKLMEMVVPRLSRIRTKAELVSRVRMGKIKIGKPSALFTNLLDRFAHPDVRKSGA